jgi:hypothetical protein
MQPGHGAHHSHPSSADVKEERDYTFYPPKRLHGV